MARLSHNASPLHAPAFFAALLVAVAAVFSLLAPAPYAGAAGTGELIIEQSASGTSASASYKAYQLFSADVSESIEDGSRTASNVIWASDASRAALATALASAGAEDTDLASAQSEASWLSAEVADGSEAATNIATSLAGSLGSASPDATLSAGTSASLASGWWLIISDTSSASITGSTGRSATAPILVLVGGSAQTVSPKTAAPTLDKYILEDSTNLWQRGADATVGDDLWRRDEITVPAGITGYGTGIPYRLVLRDTLSSTLDSSKVLSSLSVRINVGSGASWDDASSAATGIAAKTFSRRGSAGSSSAAASASSASGNVISAKGGASDSSANWQKLSGCSAKMDGSTLVVEFPCLAKKLKALGSSLGAGAQICVTYNAPIAKTTKTGSAGGTQTRAELEYPVAPSASGGSVGQGTRSVTQRVATYAYTWHAVITKRTLGAEDELAGAVLRITDDRGRCLDASGAWVDGDATVTTGDDGTVKLAGADSGTFQIEEVTAPAGHKRFEGKREFSVEVEGLDFESHANARIKIDAKAADPLRVDSVGTEAGKVELSLLDEKTTAGGGGSETSGGGHSPAKTGDALPWLAGVSFAALAVAVVAALIVGRKHRREDGDPR